MGVDGTIDGGLGDANTFDYSAYGQANPVVVDLNSGIGTGTAALLYIQNLIGGQGDDTLLGDAAANRLDGGLGNDLLSGTSGNDTYIFNDVWGQDEIVELANGGTDTLDFSALPSSLTFTFSSDLQVSDGNGNTLLQSITNLENVLAGLGDDLINVLDGAVFTGVLDGGTGDDLLDLSDYSSSILFDLALNTVTASGINLTISKIENYIGGSGDDQFNSSSADEILSGGPGDDAYNFYDGWGKDTVFESADNGIDTFDFSLVTRKLQIILGSIIVKDDLGNTVTYLGDSVEQFLGGVEDDVIAFGTDGEEFANGLGTIDGGGGQNTLDYSAYTTSVQVDLLAGTATGTAGVTNILNLIGGSGADILSGDLLDNHINGGEGDDTLNGNDGQDTLVGDNGNDQLNGGLGDDQLLGSEGDDILKGDAGDDFLFGGLDADTLSGGDGDDNLTGDAGNDTLLGDAGNDTLHSDAGNDALSGGTGENLYNYTSDYGIDTIFDADGTDTVDFTAFSTNLTVMVGSQTVIQDGSGSALSVSGVQIEQLLTGSGDDNILFQNGGRFAGSIDLNTGADTLDFSDYQISRNITLNAPGSQEGIAGTANIIGGFDNVEQLIGSAAADTLTGISVVSNWIVNADGNNQYSTDNTTLAFTNFENLQGGSDVNTFQINGTQQLNLFGGNEADHFVFADNAILEGLLDGGEGNDTIDMTAFTSDTQTNLYQISGVDGFVGSIIDILSSFANVDNFIAGSGSDILVGLNSQNTWIVDDSNQYQNGGSTLNFSRVDLLQGGGVEDTFLINSSQDISLNGGAGSDQFIFSNGALLGGSITGGSGEDLLNFSNFVTASPASGYNVMLNLTTGVANFAAQGIGQFEKVIGSMGRDSLIGSPQNDEIHGGGGDDIIIGAGGNDLLYGDGGFDIIEGDAGNDFIVGGAGIDMVNGGTGKDTYYFGDNWGIDIIGGSTENTAEDIMDFSTLNNSLLIVLSGVVAKSDDNIAAHVHNSIQRVIGTNYDDHVFIPSQTPGSSAYVDAGLGNDTINYSLFETGVQVNLDSGNGPGLAGFGNFESIIGSAFDDVFIGSGNFTTILGGFGFDIVLNYLCNASSVLDLENVICAIFSGKKDKAVSLQEINIIIVQPDTGWVNLSPTIPTVLIDALSWLDKIEYNDLRYLSYLKSVPHFAPEAGNLVELPAGVGMFAKLSHLVELPPILELVVDSANNSNNLTSCFKSREIAIIYKSSWDLIIGQENNLIQHQRINVGNFVDIQNAQFGNSIQPYSNTECMRVLDSMTVEIANKDVQIFNLDKKMMISFSLMAETISSSQSFGIMYFDNSQSAYVMLNSKVLYWDENALDGIGSWVNNQPSPDAAGRIFTDQSITGTFVLVAIPAE